MALIGLSVAVIFLSLTDVIPHRLADYDTELHALFYGLLTLFALLSWPSHRRWVAILTMTFGLGVETIQILLPSRSFSLEDLAANAFGIGLVCICVWCVKQWRAN